MTERVDKSILSAGEIGAFTVCPRSWKLKWLDRVRPRGDTEAAGLGIKLHHDWASELSEASSLLTALRYVVASTCAAITAFLFVRLDRKYLKVGTAWYLT